jgi:hypothetical protein
MPCRQTATHNGTAATSGAYRTQAECLQACKEGACCEGTTCTVKPACQCQGTGKVFKGVGTTCTPNPCGPPPVCNCSEFGKSPCSGFGIPAQYKVTISRLTGHLAWANGVWTMGLVPNTGAIQPDLQSATWQYETSQISNPHLIRLDLVCDSTSTSLRYFYTINITDGFGGAQGFPVGGIAGGNFYLDGSQPCQGQTLGIPFTAVVECIPNPLP